MAAPKTLLRGGTLLIHDDADNVVPTAADLLMADGLIAKIEADIDPAEHGHVTVVDCTSKIISPGFVDTHHHLWQTQLKGSHANQTLLEYFPCGDFTSSLYTPDDMFWGQLSGCLEALDAGTTTVVDHAHCNITAEHSREALRATVSSGLRSVFCYTPVVTVKTWAPFTLDPSTLTADWVMPTFEALAAQAPFGARGRVRLGFGFDGVSWPDDAITALYRRVRAAGAHLITTHGTGGAMWGRAHPALTRLDELGLLGPDVLVSHGAAPDPRDAALLAASGAAVASTPATELQMGMQPVLALQPAFRAHASLGVDCHSNGAAGIPAQMNLALQAARAARHAALAADVAALGDGDAARWGRWSRSIPAELSVQAAFNLGTVGDARAAGLAGEVGVLAAGRRADVVVFDGASPGMLAAAVRDPVAAVVQHSSVRDVEAVYVDGVLRKAGGRLCDVGVVGGVGGADEVQRWMGWGEVASELLRSRERIVREVGRIDMKACEMPAARAFGMNLAGMVE